MLASISSRSVKSFFTRSLVALILIPAGLSAKIVFDSSEINLNAQPFDTSLTGTFTFTNTGDEPVSITNITTSCGCTVASPEAVKTYQPGETGNITAKFEIGARTGNQHKVVNVFINNAETPTHRLQFKARIPKIVDIHPMLVRWKDNETDPQNINLKIKPELGIKVTEVKSTNPSFLAELVTVKEGESYRIVVTPLNKEGTRFGNITITAVNEAGEEKTFTAYARNN